MDEARFENPKVTIGGSGCFANSNTTMLSNVVSKLRTPSILERFQAMVKEREDEVRVWSGDEVVSLSMGEMVRLYELVLSELTFNSKPLIIGLTMIAGEQRKHGQGIADAICARILEVPGERKLLALYLLDSIVKNIGKEYVTYFAARLPQVFCETYKQVDSTVHFAMRRLFGTWSTVFPLSVLGKIEACLQFSPSLNNQCFSSLNSLRAVEKASPSHTGFDHGLSRVSGRQEQSFEISGVNLDRPKYLINAYGIDEREKSSDYKRQKVDHLNVNGIHKNASLKAWQDTEEEEFNWVDMSPAFRSKPGSGTHPAGVPLVTTNFRSKLSNQGQLPVFNDSYYANEDISAISSALGVIDRIAGFRNGKTQPPCSPFTQESISLPKTVPQSSQHPVTVKGVGRNEGIAYQPATVAHQGPNRSPFPLQQLDAIGSKPQVNVPQFSIQKHGLIPPNHHIPTQINLLQPQPQPQPRPRPLQGAYQNIVSPTSVSGSSDLVRPSLSHGYIPPQGHVTPIGTVALNNIHSVHSSVPVTNPPLQLPGALPPMPQGPSSVSSQILPISQNQGPIGPNPRVGGSLSGLLNTLMAQGVISLTYQDPRQHSMSLEFNQDLLKVRRESAITALYADLPRQCTTCGLRFKCREAHSSHTDWHVTKNRTSKSRKQRPSRNWFVNSSMWLSSAEALGTDAVPEFLSTEDAVENNGDEEMAVPADDIQTACALCGEPFDDFYSDETEEWMYKGAVYMNAPSVLMVGIDRPQLGPIVHAKCRSETSGVSAEDLRNERKRKRLPDTHAIDCRVSIITY